MRPRDVSRFVQLCLDPSGGVLSFATRDTCHFGRPIFTTEVLLKGPVDQSG